MNLGDEIEQDGTDDSSDEDFNPAGCGNASVSEEESGEDVSGGEEQTGTEENRKRRKGGPHPPARKKRKNGKVKEVVEKGEEEKENSKKVEVVSDEDNKKKSDSLWADFLRDCDPPAKKSLPQVPASVPVPKSSPKTSSLPESKHTSEPKKVTEILTFAGEEVKLEKEPAARGVEGRRSGGLGSLLSRLGKGGKLSTLEKSKLDWESFKVNEGIKEDLETHNRGKDGYLEKQDFLTRTDVRQFELEKQMRTQRRSLNR